MTAVPRKCTLLKCDVLPRGIVRMAFILFFLLSRAEGDIVLTEVMFDPSGSERYDEFVELYNTGPDTVDLEGWTIGDAEELDRLVPLEGGTSLPPGRFALILDSGYMGRSTTYDPLPPDVLLLAIEDASFGKGGWSNSSPEPVRLFDPEGREVARYTYSPGNPPGYSDEKVELDGGDSPDNWRDSVVELGTPGLPNSVSPQALLPSPYRGRVVVNEVMFKGEEWIELYNASEEDVSLAGWSISDSDTLHRRRLPGCSLPPHGYLVIGRWGCEPSSWPSLNDAGDEVFLYDDLSRLVERMAYQGDRTGGRKASLERVNPALDPTDPHAWAPSVPEGGTPGERNSTFLEAIPTSASVSASPDPFRDRTIVTYKVPSEASYVRLWVFNSRGQLVRKLLEGAPSGGEGEVVWEGRDDRGELVPMGIYVLYLEAMDHRRQVLHRAKGTVAFAGRFAGR